MKDSANDGPEVELLRAGVRNFILHDSVITFNRNKFGVQITKTISLAEYRRITAPASSEEPHA